MDAWLIEGAIFAQSQVYPRGLTEHVYVIATEVRAQVFHDIRYLHTEELNLAVPSSSTTPSEIAIFSRTAYC